MTVKLVAIDTDGTLLNSQGEILDSTKEVVKKALDKGIKIVLCSGRPIAGLAHYMKELGISGEDQYAVTLNGVITRNADGKAITQDLVSNEMYRKMTTFGKKHHVPFNIVDADSRIITADHDVDFIELVQAWENKAGMLIREPDDFPDDFMISKGCFVGDPHMLDQIEPLVRKEFEQDLYVVRADKNFLELLNPKVNKGNGLKELGEKIGITPEEMAAFGDAGNDITMFEIVKTSICMGNGTEEAKKAAEYITASNDEDGIAQAFEKYIF